MEARIAKLMADDHKGDGGDEKEKQKDNEDTKLKQRHGAVTKQGHR
jgi:hypothetical protein